MKTTISILLAITFSIFGQTKVYKLEEIIVSGSRFPTNIENSSKNIILLFAKDISQIPVNNFSDLLKFVNSVDVRTRGAEGMQSDISIRGGSFEQTLVLIDGVKMNDPQTGHHNLNLPLSLDNIERVEILKGNGSKVFGANAFSGAVNFITKKNFSNSISINSIGGENGLFDLGLSINTSFNNSFFISRKKSDGYKFNTNFKNDLLSFSQNIVKENFYANLFVGYVDKAFGANSFYSDRFPNQFERTLTRIANIKSEIDFDDLTFSSKIFYRNNFDDYHLDFVRPDWNHNTHFTEFYGTEIQTNYNSAFGKSSMGIEFIEDKISSSNLGKHLRNQLSVFAEHNYIFENKFSLSAGLFLYKYSNVNLKILPGIDIGYFLTEKLKMFVSYGSSLRVPTYTELFYVSPANMGNPSLLYEESNNYEAGLNYKTEFYNLISSIFFRDGKNLIDWVRLNKTDPWKVENVTNLKTTGMELSSNFNIKKIVNNFYINNIELGYTYLSSNRKTERYESKYLIEHFKHQLVIKMNTNFIFDSNFDISFRYESRENYPSRSLIDAQLTKSFNELFFFVRATNLLNKTYFDFPGVILPGRWFSAGLKYTFKFMDEK